MGDSWLADQAAAENHPLDDEDVTIRVTVTHKPTRLVGEATVKCPPDDSPDAYHGLLIAGEQAMDRLLAIIETSGGG